METSTPKTNYRVETDTVILEVRRIKEELMKRDNYDLATMFRSARARQANSGHQVVDRSQPRQASSCPLCGKLRMKNLLQAALQPPHNLLEAAQGNALFAPLQPMQSRGWQAYFLGKLRVSHFPALLAEKLAELIFQSVRHPKTLQKNPFQMWNNSWPAF